MVDVACASVVSYSATPGAVPDEIPLPVGAEVPRIRVLDPDCEESIALQLARCKTLLTEILPPVLTDSARQAVLIRNANWFNRPPERPALEAIANTTARTRQAVLLARGLYERGKNARIGGVSQRKKKKKKKSPAKSKKRPLDM